MIKLIAVAGYPNSGKDEVVKIAHRFGYTPKRWAEPIGQALALIYDQPVEKFRGSTPEDKLWRETPNPAMGGKTPLQAMRHLGERMRDFDEAVWSKALINILDDTPTIIGDTRKVIEAKNVKAAGGKLWYIERRGFTSNEECDNEVHLLKEMADVTFYNAWALEDFQAEVESYFQMLAGHFPAGSKE